MTAVATTLDAYILTGQSLAGGVAEAAARRLFRSDRHGCWRVAQSFVPIRP